MAPKSIFAIGVLSPNNAAAAKAARMPRSNFTPSFSRSASSLFRAVSMIKTIERGRDREQQRVVVGLE
jgi:hypothetical protein